MTHDKHACGKVICKSVMRALPEILTWGDYFNQLINSPYQLKKKILSNSELQVILNSAYHSNKKINSGYSREIGRYRYIFQRKAGWSKPKQLHMVPYLPFGMEAGAICPLFFNNRKKGNLKF